MSNVTLGGNPIEVGGRFPQAGDQAPAFTLVGKDLKDVSLADFAGKRKVLNIVPSLDTPVCQASARRFNQAASALPDTVVLVISADLPFAAGRFCTAEASTTWSRCRPCAARPSSRTTASISAPARWPA